MIVNLKPLLLKAQKEGYAVGAFNTNNMEITKAIITAAEELNSPVIVSISEGGLTYGGEVLVEQVKYLARKSSIPVVVHLDHGKSLEIINKAIKAGFSSVMLDASAFTFEKNLSLTQAAVKIAKKKRISIEAELGTIGGSKSGEKSASIIYPSLEQVKLFVKKAKVDALALGLGTSHGIPVPHEHVEQKLLQEVSKNIKTPIVLHGASNLPKAVIRQAIRNGVVKINIDTELRQAFTESIRKFLGENKKEIDPRKYLIVAQTSVKQVVKDKIKLFGSDNKA